MQKQQLILKWFTDQNSNHPEIEDKIYINAAINESITYKNDMVFSSTKRSIICKRLWIFVKVYAKNISRNIGKKISQNLSRKYSQKRLDHANKFATEALKTTSKKAIWKTAEATGDLNGNEIAVKVQNFHWRIIQKRMKKKYLEENLHLQN